MAGWHIEGQYMETCNCSFVCPCIGSNLAATPTEGDCKATDTIYITGVCKAEILASVSNATGYPNDNITNKISLELQQQIPLPIDFNYNLTLNINQDAIYITDNTTYSYANGKLVIVAEYIPLSFTKIL